MNYVQHLICIALITTGAIADCQVKPGTLYPSGLPGVDYNLLDGKGKRHGVWVQQWKETRNLLYRGQYEHGVPTGVWKRYYENGDLSAEMNHVQDTTIIDAVMYHPGGKKISSSGRFQNKKKTGLWKTFDTSGKIISDENFVDSLFHGECIYYYDSGAIVKKLNYDKGKLNGAAEEYFKSGKLYRVIHYKEDQFHGPYKLFTEEGLEQITGEYFEGQKHGAWTHREINGVSKMRILYSHGAEVRKILDNGTFTEYYRGEIPKSEYNYEHGQKNGPFTEWYDAGKFEQVPASPEDQKIGIVYREKLTGTQIKFKGNYLNNLLEGPVTYYRENGAIDRIEEYEKGKLISTKVLSK